ncbi:Hypothetical predicted protein, partial [Paramuricea clavata]
KSQNTKLLFSLANRAKFSLANRAKHHRRILEHFVNRCRREYLLSLREKSRVNANRQNIATISVGDIMIIMNEKTKQQFWKFARVEDLLPGQDGVVRAARVRVACSEGKPNVLLRSIAQLIPLEFTERLEEMEGEAARRRRRQGTRARNKGT